MLHHNPGLLPLESGKDPRRRRYIWHLPSPMKLRALMLFFGIEEDKHLPGLCTWAHSCKLSGWMGSAEVSVRSSTHASVEMNSEVQRTVCIS